MAPLDANLRYATLAHPLPPPSKWTCGGPQKPVPHLGKEKKLEKTFRLPTREASMDMHKCSALVAPPPLATTTTHDTHAHDTCACGSDKSSGMARG